MLRDQGFILTVCGNDHPQLLSQGQGSIQLRVIDPERSFVSQEYFKRTDPCGDNLAELALCRGVIFRDSHVKGKIAGGLTNRLGHPELEPFESIVLARWATHLDECGGTSCQSRLAPGLIGVLRVGPHEREIDVNVRVDESGEDKFSRSINYRGVRRRRNIAIDARDGFAFAIDISGVALTGSNDFSVLDQQRHRLNNREWTRILTANGHEWARKT